LRGYISVPSAYPAYSAVGHKVSGFLDPDLEENIMSAATARRLGLEITRREHGDPTVVKLERDIVINAKILGSVEVTWRGTVELEVGQERFGLKLWVYRSGEEGLIMGQPFHQKRHYYRGQERVEE
jgi:predicted AlkP superfamily phosphohydrolase/phosphomutase